MLSSLTKVCVYTKFPDGCGVGPGYHQCFVLFLEGRQRDVLLPFSGHFGAVCVAQSWCWLSKCLRCHAAVTNGGIWPKSWESFRIYPVLQMNAHKLLLRPQARQFPASSKLEEAWAWSTPLSLSPQGLRRSTAETVLRQLCSFQLI